METTKHDSTTCTLGPNGTRCEMCEFAEQAARRRRVSRVIDQWIAREGARREAGEMIERAIDETLTNKCRWCQHPDRKVNVQGFCCHLCYNSWLGDEQEKSWRRRLAQRTEEQQS